MNLSDIIALAKQGYKPDDIKELIALSKEDEKESNESKATENSTDGAEGEPEEQTVEGTTTEDSTDNVDYKKLYEESQKKIEALQKENVNKDLSEGGTRTPSDEEILKELAREFM